jgi:hypothetical protein
VLDRPLESVPASVAAVLDGRDPDYRKPTKAKSTLATADERRKAFLARVSAALQSIFGEHEDEVPAAVQAAAEAVGVHLRRRRRSKPGNEPNLIMESFGGDEPEGEEPVVHASPEQETLFQDAGAASVEVR